MPRNVNMISYQFDKAAKKCQSFILCHFCMENNLNIFDWLIPDTSFLLFLKRGNIQGSQLE